MFRSMTQVVAGVLKRRGMILVGRRRADQPHALKWEFPGGKMEPQESAKAALTRELNEELGIDALPGPELTRYEFTYPGKKPILLIFIEVNVWHGEIENRIFESLEWALPARLRDYDFLEGDAPFLEWFNDPRP